MNHEKLLQALEDAYNKGVTFEQMQGKLSDEVLVVAEDFFSKKKASTEDSQIASPSVLVSEPSVRSTGSLSTQLESDSQAINKGLLDALEGAKNKGIGLDQLQAKLSPEVFNIAQQYYGTLDSERPHTRTMREHPLIIDDNPSEIGRLWNRAVAGGILANEIAMGEQSQAGMDYEKIAYLNSIIQRDAVRDSDYLYDESGSAVDDFVLDVIRTIPESLISMATAIKPGIEGLAAGVGVGTGVGLAGGPLAGITVPVAAGVGATSGYFGATSLALEYGHSIMDVLREEGVDVTDPQVLADAVENEQIMKKARSKGLKRGIPIGIFDAVSGGVAGKIGKTVVKSVSKSARNQAAKVLAAETLVQAGLGGGGELTGQLVAGEEIRPRDIALEAFAEIGPAAPVMAYRLAGRIGKTPGEIGYIDWAETQNQSDLKDANEVAFLINNGEIASIDNEIAKLRESQQKDPTVKKAVEGKIRRLRDEKYDLLRDLSEQVLKLDEQQKIQAAELSKEIYTAAEVLRKADNLSVEEQAAIEEEMQSNSKALDDLVAAKPRQVRDDQEDRAEEVPGTQQERQELGDVPESQTSRAKAQISGILQAREEDLGRSSRHISINQARQKFEGNKKGFFNLFDKNDAGALRQMLDEGVYPDGTRISPLEQRTLARLILASESMLKLEPDAAVFNVGFGRRGYKKAGKNAGFASNQLKGSAAITSGFKREKTDVPNKIAVEIPLKESTLEGRGTQDRFTPQGAAYHEIYHNIFAKFFNGNPIDFNQFRKLIVRRLKESNVKELNAFTNRYLEREDETSAGAYRSEEFMVELGGLLADERIAFEPSFLEEVKAFLNAVVGKLTGQRVQIFEDAALAKDLAAYMTGLADTVRAGGDLSQVTMSERLKTDRFQRRRPETKEVTEVDEFGFEKPTGEMETTPSENVAGIPDPENYDKTLDPLEKVLGFIKPRMENFLKRLEKTLGVDRLRATRRDVLQALEVSESINVQHINRFFLALRQVNKITNKLSDSEREQAANLANDYLFGENNEIRESALNDLIKINPELANQLGRLRAVRASMQESIQNSSVFAKLSTELQDVIIDNTANYGTRTYRAFTDPNFKFDPKLRRAAYKAMIEGKIAERGYDIDENMTEKIEREMRKNDLDPTNMDDIFRYVEFNEKEINAIRKSANNALRALEEAAEKQKGSYGEGLSGSRDLGKMRIPTKKLRERKDLPVELMDYLGVEKDPYIKFSQTIATLTNMVQQFTLTDRVNEIAQQSNLGDLIITKSVIQKLEKDLLSFSKLVDLGRDTGLIQKGESLVDFYKRVGLDELVDQDGNRIKDSKAERDGMYSAVYDYFKKNYTVITEKKSPMNGKAVKNDFAGMLKQTPLYQSDSKALQAYYKLLLQMRRVRVLYNLPTWRKNIMGGWYFLGANFVLPYNKHRGGLTVMKDLQNRFKKMKDGVADPEVETVLNRMGELGLLGSSPNMGLFTDINQSFIDQLNGVSPEVAWKWLPEGLKQAQRKMGTRAARIAYQYGFIDDYTKMIAYLTKRENFAKRLASNPEGKSYGELSASEQQQVDEMTAERIKQNMPTMSRIHPAFRNLFKTPFGDFLSFRVEAFRSFFSIYKNAVADLSEAMTNQNLSKSQRSAFMTDGVGSLTMGILLAGASTMGYQAVANLILEDDEEEELGQQARGTNYILPPWMQGSNIVAVDMDDKGKIRFANISSEDPYDEIQGLIYGREGISRNKTLTNIAQDFSDPNLAARLLFNLADGKDSYGRPILNNQDVGWFNRYVIGPSLTEWSDAYGSYIFKEAFVPPNINYIAREFRKRIKEAEENPDIELQPLETAAQLSTAIIFRDYPVDIAKQFYYNMQDQNFREPYTELTEPQKVNRQARLDEVKRAYEFAANYSAKFDNFNIVKSVERTIKRTFSKSPEEEMYILYDIELPN